MTDFAFGIRVSDELETDSAALGTASPKYTEKEISKAVVHGNAQNFVLAGNDAAIHGFIRTVEPFTVNDGVAMGTVQTKGRVEAQVAATYTCAVGDIVVAAAQAAVGTAGRALVRPHTVTSNISNAGIYQWRVIRIVSGNGSAGSVVLLERQ